MKKFCWILSVAYVTVNFCLAPGTYGAPAEENKLSEMRIKVNTDMVFNEGEIGNPKGLVDEQDQIIGPPAGNPASRWEINSSNNKKYPFSSYIDLGKERNLSKLWLYDVNGNGKLVISAGKPDDWKELLTYDCAQYLKWVPLTMDVETRYVRFTLMDPGAQFTEVVFYEYTPEAYQSMLERKAAEKKLDAERQAAHAKAKEEMEKRPLVDAGKPFGKLYLIDEIDCGVQQPDHEFKDFPDGASKVETILGKPCRVLSKTTDSSAYFRYRIGRMKLLTPGSAYVLEIEYPEDSPRTVIITNGGNETERGFHTGATLGDAMHPKYVNNLNESISTPLSGKYETWKILFNLHDRAPGVEFIRGDGQRNLKTAEEGFYVTVAQFSAKNIPLSNGAAVSRIRLYGVPDASKYNAKYTLPPTDLPHRRLFWREEMADGVVSIADKPEDRTLKDPLDWWRFKRNTMKFLGMNTYAKDLLEFGACQHWDSTEYGGNKWVYFNVKAKDFWENIVGMMGEAGFEILPYYEYAGSKGSAGLGPQKRAKPLTRDDAYTHIKWIESANADITDPDTYADFKKMLDLTVIKFKDKAKFAGIWFRPRSQMPMGFGDATRERFAKEANAGVNVTRKQLIADPALLAKYEAWWFIKRKEFLVAMRDYLRQSGINDKAFVLYTAAAGEPGVAFKTWDPIIVTDDVDKWKKIVMLPEHLPSKEGGKIISPMTVQDVVQKQMYLDALLAPALNWGDWECNHSNPPPDPANYKETDGIMMSMAFNRLYTVSDPKAFETFREPSGLTVIRHYSLNENMMFDKDDKPIIGYFVVDMERAGPFCMMAEACAMANGDPTQIGYLTGQTFTRGFPEYVRNFNAAFLSLPALPSKIVPGAADDNEVVVREIKTEKNGTYLSVVNIGMKDKAVTIRLPMQGKVSDASTGEAIIDSNGAVKLTMYPYQLRALRIQQ
ncbi:MAG TPA: hypothetical protein DCZ94_06820 [Lentisphaeria bacterium]|nr:MAG: hypothetical protein A2X48_10570 [Lentisphaerae bacterium GWF2_49_21]HBC86648.1 hypothetical protein [Lentisphaeria bacterium]